MRVYLSTVSVCALQLLTDRLLLDKYKPADTASCSMDNNSLVRQILAIQQDPNLTEAEKARKRQQVMSSRWKPEITQADDPEDDEGEPVPFDSRTWRILAGTSGLSWYCVCSLQARDIWQPRERGGKRPAGHLGRIPEMRHVHGPGCAANHGEASRHQHAFPIGPSPLPSDAQLINQLG